MSVVNLEALSNDDLKKRVASLISLDDWSDECGQCGRPTLLHKGGPCTRQEKESPETINKIWSEFRKRIKPIVTVLKSEYRKDTEESLLLDGLKKLFVQNADSMNAVVNTLKESFRKTEVTSPASSPTVRTARLTKPAKVPSWSRDMTLETYIKQIETWTEINEDVPEHVKYIDFVENLKVNKDIKGLPRFVGEHVLTVLEKKSDQTIKKVLEILIGKYGRTRTEKVEECVEDWLKFKEDMFEEDDELILAMEEIDQRRKELKITEDEWFSVWMLGRVKKRKRMDNFEYQALRQVVKEGGAQVIENFKRKFKEMKVEGNRKSVAVVLYSKKDSDRLPETHYTEAELNTMYMGAESDARKRYQRQVSGQRGWSFDRQWRSLSRGSQYGGYGQRQSRFDRSQS